MAWTFSKNCHSFTFFKNDETLIVVLTFNILTEQKESDGLK